MIEVSWKQRGGFEQIGKRLGDTKRLVVAPRSQNTAAFTNSQRKKDSLGICVSQKWVRRLHGDLELGSRVPRGMVMDLFAIKVLDGAVDPH